MSSLTMDEKLKQYRAYVADTSDFNKKLLLDRRSRLPYVDQQTNIAQIDSSLWRNEQDRLQSTPESGFQAQIFRYPANRWQKRHQNHLNNYEYPSNRSDHQQELKGPSACQTTHVSSNTSTASTLSVPAGNHLDLIDQMNTDLTPFNNNAIKLSSHCQSQIDGSFNLSQSQQPPRSNSVGSYSCVDSDSRDQSSATSQSVDSPRRGEDDQIYRNHSQQSIHNGITPEHSSGVDSGYCKDVHGDEEVIDEPNSSKERDTLKNSSAAEGESFDAYEHLEANTRETENLLDGGRTKRTNGYIKSSPKHGVRKSKNSQASSQPIASIVSGDRPYLCETCDHSYKTRPGLSYHFIHVHEVVLPKKLIDRRQGSLESPPPDVQQPKQKVKKTSRKEANDRQVTRASRRIRGVKVGGIDSNDLSKCDDVDQQEVDDLDMDCSENTSDNIQDAGSNKQIDPSREEMNQLGLGQEAEDDGESRAESDKTVIEAGLEKADLVTSPESSERIISISHHKDSANPRPNSNESSNGAKQNIFCDFCLGTVERNRRTRLPEELISCTNCGSSGHPSCLQFSEENLVSVKKYKWQCIDCKTCTYCDTADNEAQLLICNDCDRSYHTYCLRPPLSELPEENWSCSMCVAASEPK